MESMIEVNALMVELLEYETHTDKKDFTDRQREIIDEISDFAEQTGLYKKSEDRGNVAFEDMTARQVFYHMLERVVNAPTALHRDGSIICLMPVIRKKLLKEEAEKALEGE